MEQQPGQQPTGTQRQYSPDGRWWWDGQQWQPVQQAPGGPPGRGPRRRRLWPWLTGGIALLVVLMGTCIALVGNAGSRQQQSAANATAAAVPTSVATIRPTTAPTAAPAREGGCSPQPCANDNYGWIVNISNVRYDASGGQFENPEAGNVFVFMDVTFANKLDQEQHANPTSFVLQDGAGVKHTWRPLVEACPTWEPVNVTKGATFGPKCLSFEATAGKPAGLTLVWTPSGFGGGYNIKLS